MRITERLSAFIIPGTSVVSATDGVESKGFPPAGRSLSCLLMLLSSSTSSIFRSLAPCFFEGRTVYTIRSD